MPYFSLVITSGNSSNFTSGEARDFPLRVHSTSRVFLVQYLPHCFVIIYLHAVVGTGNRSWKPLLKQLKQSTWMPSTLHFPAFFARCGHLTTSFPMLTSVEFICVTSGQCLKEVGKTPLCSYRLFLRSRILMHLQPSCDHADDNTA